VKRGQIEAGGKVWGKKFLKKKGDLQSLPLGANKFRDVVGAAPRAEGAGWGLKLKSRVKKIHGLGKVLGHDRVYQGGNLLKT